MLLGRFLKLQGDENPLQQGIMENRTLTRTIRGNGPPECVSESVFSGLMPNPSKSRGDQPLLPWSHP